MRHPSLCMLLAPAILLLMDSASAQAPPARPNIVVIMLDDQRWDALGATHGFPPGEVVSPVILNELAAHGVTFTNAYVTTALCAPSRASFLSGQYAHRHGVHGNGLEEFRARQMPLEPYLLPVWLQQAGYRTALVGKYSNGYKAFDTTHLAYVPDGWTDWHALEGQGHYEKSTVCDRPEGGALGCAQRAGYSTFVLRDRAVDFIRRAAPQSQTRPFFLLFTPKAVHGEGGTKMSQPDCKDRCAFNGLTPWRPPSHNESPLDAPEWMLDNVPPLSPTQQGQLDYVRQLGLETSRAVAGPSPNPVPTPTPSSCPTPSPEPPSCAATTDRTRAVSAILQELIAQGVDGNTVVIYTSDNGYFWGEHRLDSKTMPYEEALRVPLIIRPADRMHRPDVTSLVLNVDLTATIVDLADDVVDVVPTLLPQDGQSLVPFLKGVPPDPAWRTDFLFEAWEDGDGMPRFEGVKSASLGKYVEYANGEKEYYTRSDTHELDNRVADFGHRIAVNRLKARLQALRPPAEPLDLIFASSFELGDLRRWSLGPVSPDLVVSHEAALFDDKQTAFGLKVVVDATPDDRFVQDDTPDNEPRYRARFHFHANGFDPGPSGEVVLFFAGKDAESPQPSRRLVIIALQKVGVDYQLMARVREVEAANGDADVAEFGPFKITNPQLQHRVEFEWRKAGDTTPPHDGYFRIWIDSKDPDPEHPELSTRTNLATGQHAVDFGRLGAISVHTAASGSLYLDGFVSHRSTADP